MASTWTYSDEDSDPPDAAEDGKNWARFLISDTETGLDPDGRQIMLLSDQQIKRCLTLGFQRGMEAVAFAMLTKLGQQPTTVDVTGGTKVTLADRKAAVEAVLAGAKKGILPEPGETLVPSEGWTAPGTTFNPTQVTY